MLPMDGSNSHNQVEKKAKFVHHKPNGRINTVELKARIFRKIGHQKAEKYFSLLKSFFSYKISKSDFDGLCMRIIGRETIPLHNQLIRSILKNASTSSSPPTKKAETKIATKDANGYQMNCFKSLYGDAFPPCPPRKLRSSVCRDKKVWDRPSPLGPLGKPQSILVSEETSLRAHEQQSAAELISLGSRPPLEVISVEDGEEVEQISESPGVQSRSPVTAPFGISVNSLGPKKTLPITCVSDGTCAEICQDGGQLPDTQSLRNCILRKLEAEGMEVSVNCTNVLNNALDAYLKRLIEPCMALAKLRQENVNRSRPVHIVNGRLVRNEHVNVSMVDFSTAMEMNPQILGENWASQLERVSLTLYG